MDVSRSMFLRVVLLISVITGQAYAGTDVVDLSTLVKTNETMNWLGHPYEYEKQHVLKDFLDGMWIEAYGFRTPVHSGTHMDAPCHFSQNGQRLHEVPLERFFGPGAVMDVKAKVDKNPDYEFSVEDLTAWEEENGAVPEGAIVLIHTGWSKRFYGDAERYWGTTDVNRPDLYSFPGIRHEVSQILVEQRNVNAIGIDAGSPDSGKSHTDPQDKHKNHLVILKNNNRLILENVNSNLELLTPTGYNIHAFPMKLFDTCGSPMRLVAFKTPSSASAASVTMATGTLLLLTTAIAATVNIGH